MEVPNKSKFNPENALHGRTAVAVPARSKVVSIEGIDYTGIRSDLAQSLDNTYEAVKACANAFLARGNQKVAARLAIISLAVLAATHDGEWNSMYLHSSDEAALQLKRACQAAHAAIQLMFMQQLDGETQAQGNTVLNCLKEAIEKAELAGVR